MDTYGLLSLLPTAVVVATAVLTRRPIIALVTGVVVALVMLDPSNIMTPLADTALSVMMDETIGWIILVCGLFGSLIALLIRAGGASAFAETLAARANTRARALLSTWLLGLVIFIDDYLNALAVSASMKKLTDKFRISRQMLAYVADSTAAPTCFLIPISTWAVYFSGVLESSGTGSEGSGMSLYISAIPFMLYSWLALLIVPFVATGVIPLFGPMKPAEAQAVDAPPVERDVELVPASLGAAAVRRKHHAWNFIIPILSLVIFSWLYDIDVLKGVIAALAITVPLLALQRLLSLGDIFDTILEGFKTMIAPLAIVVAAFMFKAVNDSLGMPQYVIDSVKPLMTAQWLPLVAFLSMSLISFATGSSWGIFAITIPIIVPLAEATGCPLPLAIGALLSASAFGSHACFYGDATVLAAQGSGCSPMSHALTQLPYALIAAAVASVGFIALGYMFT
ncbi:Na+/H+ antiporter NhaC family protein [Microbulbifer bruguierae]|uniref:Na+/H+ antiporter NhaC family protein n=1 Tax=Microbulbifer bruguierae TaxID=3029061 RepID=A0ABY8NAI9_9GAMM|nr:Na+/H+ antiporter NhaC family protein [Microbulbifer bruguierae]WGL15097.1 Na+/H+ antiporter NhaC family protein [Microbulbifer bruguierae]